MMLELAKSIERKLKRAGATDVLIVGGYVRDTLMGLQGRDIDLEVYGLSYRDILEALSDTSFKIDPVGKSFGVIKVNNTIDVSVPRRENRVGVGHADFEVTFEPSMSIADAAARRDFTVNSVAMRLNGELIDPHGGVKDLQQRLLRATSPAFDEDPLRVLRGMQFAARFGLKLDPGTAERCKKLHPLDLSSERVWEEWKKWSLAQYPSNGLEALREAGWLQYYGPLDRLVGCPQDPEFHPEGDVWTHTLHVCDQAATITRRNGFDESLTVVCVMSALLHDIGKPDTTVKNENGRIVSPGHAQTGAPMAELFIEMLGMPRKLASWVPPLVQEHMVHVGVKQPSSRAVRRLAVRLEPATIPAWEALVEADHSGRPPLPKGNPVTAWSYMAKELAADLGKPAPILMGRHLTGIVEPGPAMGEILRAAYEMQLDGEFHTVDEALDWVEETVNGNR